MFIDIFHISGKITEAELRWFLQYVVVDVSDALLDYPVFCLRPIVSVLDVERGAYLQVDIAALDA